MGDDDDLRRRRQVQGFHGLLHASYEERGLHVSDEGSRSEHPPWSRWRRCPRRVRQVPGNVHRLENCQRLSRVQEFSLYRPPSLCAACPVAEQKEKLVLNINQESFLQSVLTFRRHHVVLSPPETHLHLNCISLNCSSSLWKYSAALSSSSSSSSSSSTSNSNS